MKNKILFSLILILLVFNISYSVKSSYSKKPPLYNDPFFSKVPALETPLTLNLDFSSGININANWDDKIVIDGKYIPQDKDIQATIKLTNIDLKRFSSYLKDVNIQEGIIPHGEITVQGKDNYNLKGTIVINNLILSRAQNQFKGNITISSQLNVWQDNITYTINSLISNSEINNLPIINNLTNTDLSLSVNEKGLTIENLKTDLNGVTISGKGDILFKETPSFNIYLETQTPFKNLVTCINKIKPIPFFYQKDVGQANITCTIKGTASDNNLSYALKYDIKDINLDKINNMNISGKITNNQLEITKCGFSYKDLPIRIRGSLTDFTNPNIKLIGKSGSLNFNINALYKDDILYFNKLSFWDGQSQILASGNYNTKKKPPLTIKGIGNIYSQELDHLLSALNLKAPILKTLKPWGKITTEFILLSDLAEKNLEIKLSGSSEAIKICNLTIYNIKFLLKKTSDELIISPFTFSLCDGVGELRTQINLKTKDITSNLITNNIDLSVLRDQLNLEQKTLAGKLFLEANIEAKAGNFKDLNGSGLINIKEGDIWEINFLKGLGQFLFIPDFESIRFHEGYSDLNFKGDNIIFDNIELFSPYMTLRGAGTISTKGPIDFKFFPEFNQRLLNSSEGLKKITTKILGAAGLMITVNGTYQNPLYAMSPTFLTPIGKIKNFFTKLEDKK